MEKPTVLVTGASTGIGHTCTSYLARAGFHVFAGVFQSPDTQGLSQAKTDSVTAIPLDVTSDEMIRAAVAQITNAIDRGGLAGLVNNAGIFIQGPLEFLPIDAFRRQFEVNVIGNLRVTQAFLPLLREGRGRIVNVGSISGRSAVPWEGAYAASKFAVEALTDVLRVELRSTGINVSIIEPGGVATPMLIQSAAHIENIFTGMPSLAREMYGCAMPTLQRLSKQSLQNAMRPERIANLVHHVLTTRWPRARYVVGRDARILAALEALPTRIRDAILARVLGLR